MLATNVVPSLLDVNDEAVVDGSLLVVVLSVALPWAVVPAVVLSWAVVSSVAPPGAVLPSVAPWPVVGVVVGVPVGVVALWLALAEALSIPPSSPQLDRSE